MPVQKSSPRKDGLEHPPARSWDGTTDENMPAGLLEYLSERGLDPNSPRLAGAVRQAQQVQVIKDVQPILLDRLQELMDFPQSTTTASAPSKEDVIGLKKALVYFQPAEFDDLIWERNTLNRCGYALCPKVRRKLSTNSTNHYTFHKKGGYTAVPKAQYERWCSDQCAERAMYIRLQLAEWPLWARDFQADPGSSRVLLLEEGRAITEMPQETKDSRGLKQTADRIPSDERQRDTTGPNPEDTGIRVVENDTTGDVSAPSLVPGGSSGSIEGYTPRYN